MNPRDIFHQIRRDFESRPHVPIALALLVAIGIATWVPVIGARGAGARTSARKSSVLSDPFDSQTK